MLSASPSSGVTFELQALEVAGGGVADSAATSDVSPVSPTLLVEIALETLLVLSSTDFFDLLAPLRNDCFVFKVLAPKDDVPD